MTGYYPEQDDEAAFVARFCELLADEARRRRMGQAGFELVAERFPIDATARSFDAAYRWVLDESPRRRQRRPLRTGPGPVEAPPSATPPGLLRSGGGCRRRRPELAGHPIGLGMRDRYGDAVGTRDPEGAVPVDHVLLPGVERGGDHRADGGRRPGGR